MCNGQAGHHGRVVNSGTGVYYFDDADTVAKDEFYAKVQEVMIRVPRGDRVIVMGDFNARIENNVEEQKGVISGHGEDVEKHGRRLPGFNAENELRIKYTHFDHNRIHKFTRAPQGEAYIPSLISTEE